MTSFIVPVGSLIPRGFVLSTAPALLLLIKGAVVSADAACKPIAYPAVRLANELDAPDKVAAVVLLEVKLYCNVLAVALLLV